MKAKLYNPLLSSLIVASIVVILGANLTNAAVREQSPPSPTPLIGSIPTATPMPTSGESPTPTTTPTATGDTRIELQAGESSGSVNIRAEPDPDADIVGTIRFPDRYEVTGRYFRWIRLRFDAAPGGAGWVFEEIVEVFGDISTVPDLSQEPTATVNPTIVSGTQTRAAIETIPGGLFTLTAEARVIDPPSLDDGSIVEETGDGARIVGALPTFTSPPNLPSRQTRGEIMEMTPTPSPTVQTPTLSGGLAPIVPILVLSGLGALGILLSFIRR